MFLRLLVVVQLIASTPLYGYDDLTVNWSGYKWRVKEGHRQPGPNYFTNESVSVTGETLNLIVGPLEDGNWSSAEVYSEVTLGHGTYSWIIDTETGNLPSQVTLGLFIYEDESTTTNHREVDIEFAKWGRDEDPTNAQFALQPSAEPGNIVRITVDPIPGPTQAEFTWSPCGVTWRLSNSRQYFAHNNTQYHMSSADEKVHINLWLWAGLPPKTSGSPVVVQLKSFQFTPLSSTDPDFIIPSSYCEQSRTVTSYIDKIWQTILTLKKKFSDLWKRYFDLSKLSLSDSPWFLGRIASQR